MARLKTTEERERDAARSAADQARRYCVFCGSRRGLLVGYGDGKLECDAPSLWCRLKRWMVAA